MKRSGANRALLLGILSLLFGVLGPFAIWSALRSLQRVPGQARAQMALVLGVVATGFMLFGIARFVVIAAS